MNSVGLQAPAVLCRGKQDLVFMESEMKKINYWKTEMSLTYFHSFKLF